MSDDRSDPPAEEPSTDQVQDTTVTTDSPELLRLKQILNHFVEKMNEVIVERSKTYEVENPAFSQELLHAAANYKLQAREAVDLIREGDFTLESLSQVTGTLYLTNLTLRWILEQQTTAFRDLMNSYSPQLAIEIDKTMSRIESGNTADGFDELLRLLELNRTHYPLLMRTGFAYLKHKKNLNYAMRYFEKAAQTPTRIEPEHYRNLALAFLATCHEAKRELKNAVNTLIRVDRGEQVEPQILYDIARMYGELGQEKKAVEFLKRALKSRSEFFSLALIDPSFETVRIPVEAEVNERQIEFGSLAKRFLQYLDPVTKAISRHRLDKTSREYRNLYSRASGYIEMTRRGYYSGYREGLIGFFRFVFPQFLSATRILLQRRAEEERDRISTHNRTVTERFKRLRTILAPVLGFTTVLMVRLVPLDGLVALLGSSIPAQLISWITAVAFGAGVAAVTHQFFTRMLTTHLESDKTAASLRKDASYIENILVPLREFRDKELGGIINESLDGSTSSEGNTEAEWIP